VHGYPQFAANQSLTDVVRAAIQQHREIWVTEADFQLLNATGFNAVRLPVGYWVLATEQVPGIGDPYSCPHMGLAGGRHSGQLDGISQECYLHDQKLR
jgi:aryl-phospho-beta-D-glucosidase BglC (GH1 family)